MVFYIQFYFAIYYVLRSMHLKLQTKYKDWLRITGKVILRRPFFANLRSTESFFNWITFAFRIKVYAEISAAT